jgi:hypothetical protein
MENTPLYLINQTRYFCCHSYLQPMYIVWCLATALDIIHYQ